MDGCHLMDDAMNNRNDSLLYFDCASWSLEKNRRWIETSETSCDTVRVSQWNGELDRLSYTPIAPADNWRKFLRFILVHNNFSWFIGKDFQKRVIILDLIHSRKLAIIIVPIQCGDSSSDAILFFNVSRMSSFRSLDDSLLCSTATSPKWIRGVNSSIFGLPVELRSSKLNWTRILLGSLLPEIGFTCPDPRKTSPPSHPS